MAKFKVGDKVRVRPFEDLVSEGYVEGESVFGIMRKRYEQYQTGTYTVTEVQSGEKPGDRITYFIDPDTTEFFWPEYALERA